MELKTATARNVARRVLRKAAQVFVDDAKRRVPRDTGSLADSFRVASSDAGKQAFANTLRDGGTRAQAVSALRDARRASSSTIELLAGPGRHPQAHMQEFGTVHHGAQPYMRPAWDSTQDEMLALVTRDLAAEVEKAVARARRKAARQG